MSFFKLFLYLLTLVVLGFSSNWLMLFLMLEFNITILMWVIKKEFLMMKMSFMMKYFLIQSMNSLLLVMFLLLNTQFNWLIVFILIFILSKMGLPPLYFWMKELIKFVSMKLMIFLLVFQKIPFFLILLFMFKWGFLYFLLCLAMMISVFEIYNQMLFNLMFFFSSMNHNLIMIFILLVSKKIFLIYFLIYFFLMLSFLVSLKIKFLSIHLMKLSLFYVAFLMLLIGLPPSPIFFLKMYSLMKILLFSSMMVSFIVVLSLVFPMIVYFNWALLFFNFSSLIEFFYESKNMKKMVVLSLFLTMILLI